MQAQQIEPNVDQIVTVSYSFPASQRMVHDAAHALIEMTMRSGAASNGMNTWLNQDALNYHLAKGLVHVCNVHQYKDIELREREAPHLLELANAVTRFCMAWALVRLRKPFAMRLDAENNPED
jgi:hypothetical protein